MGCQNRVRYKLPWPGLRSVHLYVIDNTDIVYGLQNHLPPRKRQLNQLQFQYIKLHEIMMILTEQERYQGNMCLNKLISDFGLRSMRTIACCSSTGIGQQVVVDQYLPLTTLLPFLLIFPSKSFRVLHEAVLNFLDNNLDMPCIDCGFVNRNCMCSQNEPVEDCGESIGFALSYSDKEIQTAESGPTKNVHPGLPPPPPLKRMETAAKSVLKKGKVAAAKNKSGAAKSKTKKAQSKTPPKTSVSVKVSADTVDADSSTMMTGVGGIKIKLPPQMKLQPGSKMPLSLVVGPDGPCLMPNSSSGETTVSSAPPLTSSAPAVSVSSSMAPPGYPNVGPHMTHGSATGYMSVNMPPNMPPPMWPPMDLSMAMTDPSKMLPPLPPGMPPSLLPSMLPPGMLPPGMPPGLPPGLPPTMPGMPNLLHPDMPILPGQTGPPYTNLPIMANYSSSAYDPGKNPIEYGPPRGQVTVRLPKNLNPKYINTILGTFKRMSGTRNIGIQVETIILPKKKPTMMTSAEFNAKKDVKEQVAKDGDVGKSNLKVKKVKIAVDPSGEKSVITIDDAQTVGEENRFKLHPTKKADKVWRMILDDEDSDDEKDKDKADKEKGEGEDVGKDGINKSEDANSTEEKINADNVSESKDEKREEEKTKEEKPDEGVKEELAVIDVEGETKEPLDEKTKEPLDEKTKEPLDDKTETNMNESSMDVGNDIMAMKETSSPLKHDTSDEKDISADVMGLKSIVPDAVLPPDVTTEAAISDTAVEASNSASDLGKLDVSSTSMDEIPSISAEDDNNTSLDDSSVLEDHVPNAENAATEDSTAKMSDMPAAVESDVKKSPVVNVKKPAGVTLDTSWMASGTTMDTSWMDDSEDLNDAVAVDGDNDDLNSPKPTASDADDQPARLTSPVKEPQEDVPPFTEMKVTQLSDITSAEEALKRSLAVEALESLASMGRVDAVKPRLSMESTPNHLTGATDNVGDVSTASTPNIDVSTKDESKLDDSTISSVKDSDIENDEEPDLVIDEKESDKPTESKDTDAESKPEITAKEKKKNPFDIFRCDSPLKMSRPNVDHEKKYFAKFEHLPTGEKLYKCTYSRCSQCFDTRAGAKMHNQCHSKDNAIRHLMCVECDYRTPFFKWFDLLRHLRETHNIGLSDDPSSCMFCGLVFDTQDRLARHLDFHYSSRYKCVHCGMMMMSWGQVKQHVENCPEREQTKVNFGCPHCMFVFHKRTIRNIHMLSHSDKGLTCALCEDTEVSWEHWKLLRKHYQTRHAKALTGKIGPFREDLPMKKKNPKCHVCSMEFKAQDLHGIHMLKVHDFVPYTLLPCPSCHLPFRTKRRLDYHIKHTHDQEAECDECDFVAKNKTFLKMHVTQKHSEKDHVCTECGKSFAYYHQLRVHMAHHARKIVHSCKHCEEEFTRSTELRKHVAEQHTETGEKKAYSCEHCDYWTYTRSTLAYHISKKHDRSFDDQDWSGETSGDVDIMSDQNVDPSEQMYPEHYPVSVPKKRKYVREPKQLKSNRGRKKQKRLTMPVVKRPYTPRHSKDNEITNIRPLKCWIPEKEKPVRDRNERKRLRQEEDDQKRLKRLRRDSSARTRSLEEEKSIQNDIEMDNFEAEQMQLAKSRGLLVAGKKYNRSVSRDESMIINLTYPYIDHNYYKLETQSGFSSFKPPVQANFTRRHFPYTAADYSMPDFSSHSVNMDVVATPSVSGFEEIETSPNNKPGSKARSLHHRSNVPPSKFNSPGFPSLAGDVDGPMSSTPLQGATSRLHSPIQIRSLITRALHASPSRGKASALSQQLKSIAMDMPSLEDFPELISEAGEMIPEQDLGLITDILNSMDTASISIGSRLSDGGPSSSLSLPLADQSSGAEFSADPDLPFPEASPLPRRAPVVATVTSNPAVMVEVLPKQPDVVGQSAAGYEEGMPELPSDLDLDEIELKEADYQLWHDSPQPANETPVSDFDNSLANAQIIVEFKDNAEENALEKPTESSEKPILVSEIPQKDVLVSETPALVSEKLYVVSEKPVLGLNKPTVVSENCGIRKPLGQTDYRASHELPLPVVSHSDMDACDNKTDNELVKKLDNKPDIVSASPNVEEQAKTMVLQAGEKPYYAWLMDHQYC